MSAVLEQAPLLIREMQEADVPEVVAIERLAYEFPWSEGIFRDCLKAGYSGWVGGTEAQIDGYVMLSAGAGEAHLLNLCVRPSAHGQGIGSALLEHALRHARVLAAEMLFLEVRPSNQRAVRLYRRYGFNEIGIRKNYYPARNGREDAIVMAKQLDFGMDFSE